MFGSVTVPVPGTSFLGRLSFGTSPEPLSPIVTVIVVGLPSLSLLGISTLVPGGYVEPSGFLGVTIASPFGLRVISISLGVSVVGVAGDVTVTFTGTSSSDPSGYLTRIFPVTSSPGVLSDGMVTVTLPSLSTVIPGVPLV